MKLAALGLATVQFVACSEPPAGGNGSSASSTTATATHATAPPPPRTSAPVAPASASDAPSSSASTAVGSSAAPAGSSAAPSGACVDLVPGKIPAHGDADAPQKYRPPAALAGRARAFDTSSPAPFRTLRDAHFDAAFVQAAIGMKKNEHFAKNWATAKACGFPRGAYQFVTPTDGAAQGRVMLDVLGDDVGEIPPALDLEKPPSCDDDCCNDSCAVWTGRVEGWLSTVEAATKRRALVYMVEPFFAQCLCAKPKWSDHPLWLAAWPKFDFPAKPRLGQFASWSFYQYEGNVTRYGGVLDLSLFQADAAALPAWLADHQHP